MCGESSGDRVLARVLLSKVPYKVTSQYICYTHTHTHTHTHIHKTHTQDTHTTHTHNTHTHTQHTHIVRYSDEHLRSLHVWFIMCGFDDTVSRTLSASGVALHRKLGLFV